MSVTFHDASTRAYMTFCQWHWHISLVMCRCCLSSLIVNVVRKAKRAMASEQVTEDDICEELLFEAADVRQPSTTHHCYITYVTW
jgi:hypothetical protein